MNMHTHAQTVIHTWVESWSLVTQAADDDDASYLTVRWPHIHQRLVLRPSTSSPDVPSTDRWLSCIECTELEALWEYWPCTFLSPRTDLYKQKPPTPDPNSDVRGKSKGLKTAETGSIRIIFQKRKWSVCVCARALVMLTVADGVPTNSPPLVGSSKASSGMLWRRCSF